MHLAARRPAGASLVLALACGAPHTEPEPCPIAHAVAQGAYVDCADELGLEIVELDIGVDGDVRVRFADSSDPDDIAAARASCEPAMRTALQRGRIACDSTEPGRPARADALADALALAGADGFSGSVAVVRGDAPLYDGAVGLADRSRGLANTSRTTFDCGSIMKLVTAAAIYQLEADGTLAHGTTLAEWFPDVPGDKAGITVEQLLTHGAGLHEFHDTEGDFEPLDRETALARIFAQPLLFTPGTAEAYSNSGYTVLAALVEDASGLPFAGYVRMRLLAPALLDDTGGFGEALGTSAAIGYDAEVFGCNSPACWPTASWALVGNGGLVSTAVDLVGWAAAIDRAVPFDAGTRDAFRRDLLAPAGFTLDGMPAYLYAGRDDYGFGATVVELPRDGMYVAVTTNAAPGYDDTVLAVQLAQMTAGALLELPEE